MIWYLKDNALTIYSYDDENGIWHQMKSNIEREKTWDDYTWDYLPAFFHNRKPDILLPLDAFIELL